MAQRHSWRRSFRGFFACSLFVVACGTGAATEGTTDAVPPSEAPASQGGVSGSSQPVAPHQDEGTGVAAGRAPFEPESDAGVADETDDETTLEFGWTPDSLSPEAWYVASSRDVAATKGGISRWSDRSSNGRHLTALAESPTPTFEAAGWNARRPTVRFGGKQLLTFAVLTPGSPCSR